LVSVGLTPAEIAVVLDLEPTEVASLLVVRQWENARKAPVKIPAWWNCKGPLSRRPILCETGNYIRRLDRLGYDARHIGLILVLRPGAVASFLKRITSSAGTPLAKPRTAAEQRQVELNDRRRAEAAAAAANRALWRRSDSRHDDVEACAAAALVAPLEPDQVAELVELPAPLEPPRNPWVGSSRFQEGTPWQKLRPDDRRRIHELRAEGMSTGKLAAMFGVTRAAICYTLAKPLPPCPAPLSDAPKTRTTP
jgi:hypothetical protein